MLTGSCSTTERRIISMLAMAFSLTTKASAEVSSSRFLIEYRIYELSGI